MTNEVVLLSRATNFAVVSLPGRNFPGVVVQGDTLHSLVLTLTGMEKLLEAREFEELSDELLNIKEQLNDALMNYEKICQEKNIELPYA